MSSSDNLLHVLITQNLVEFTHAKICMCCKVNRHFRDNQSSYIPFVYKSNSDRWPTLDAKTKYLTAMFKNAIQSCGISSLRVLSLHSEQFRNDLVQTQTLHFCDIFNFGILNSVLNTTRSDVMKIYIDVMFPVKDHVIEHVTYKVRDLRRMPFMDTIIRLAFKMQISLEMLKCLFDSEKCTREANILYPRAHYSAINTTDMLHNCDFDIRILHFFLNVFGYSFVFNVVDQRNLLSHLISTEKTVMRTFQKSLWPFIEPILELNKLVRDRFTNTEPAKTLTAFENVYVHKLETKSIITECYKNRDVFRHFHVDEYGATFLHELYLPHESMHVKGYLEILKYANLDFLLTRCNHGRNALHSIFTKNFHECNEHRKHYTASYYVGDLSDFVIAYIKSTGFEILLQQDLMGDTPLHCLFKNTRIDYELSLLLLINILEWSFNSVHKNKIIDLFTTQNNTEGSTIMHVVLEDTKHCSLKVEVLKLLFMFSGAEKILFCRTLHSAYTLLHVTARTCSSNIINTSTAYFNTLGSMYDLYNYILYLYSSNKERTKVLFLRDSNGEAPIVKALRFCDRDTLLYRAFQDFDEHEMASMMNVEVQNVSSFMLELLVSQDTEHDDFAKIENWSLDFHNFKLGEFVHFLKQKSRIVYDTLMVTHVPRKNCTILEEIGLSHVLSDKQKQRYWELVMMILKDNNSILEVMHCTRKSSLDGDTFMHVVNDSVFFRCLKKQYTQSEDNKVQLCQILGLQNNFGETFLHTQMNKDKATPGKTEFFDAMARIFTNHVMLKIINSQDHNMENILHFCLRTNMFDLFTHISDFLFSFAAKKTYAGAVLDIFLSRNHKKRTILHVALRKSTVMTVAQLENLVGKMPDILSLCNQQDSRGKTVLHYCLDTNNHVFYNRLVDRMHTPTLKTQFLSIEDDTRKTVGDVLDSLPLETRHEFKQC